MLNQIRPRLTYANVMSTLAAFAALATGGAYAADKIGPKDIAKNAIRAKHIQKGAVKPRKLARGAVRTPKLSDGAVTAAKLAPGVAITGPQGPAGPEGDPGLNGTARAYALVRPHAYSNCTGGASNDECTFTDSKGVTRVTREATGLYCVTTPGINAFTTPAAVTVDYGWTADLKGNASAQFDSISCASDTFKVRTERLPKTLVRNAADNGSIEVAGNAMVADDVGFSIVIP